MDTKRVLISGLDGKMATIHAQGILRVFHGQESFSTTLDICNFGLTGRTDMDNKIISVSDGYFRDIKLIRPKDHDSFLGYNRDKFDYIIDAAKGEGVADHNAELYAKHKIPFVMLSTGASDDYAFIKTVAKEAGIPCVAYPNMDARLVAWMYGIQKMGEDLPGAFRGANINLIETHQADKKDTSGTMKQMLTNITRLTGKETTTADIYSIRDPKVQEKLLKVPEDYVGWHAYHFFTVFNDHDGVTDCEELIFRRHGGECYRQGSMRALNYLINDQPTPERHTMIDVLKAGY